MSKYLTWLILDVFTENGWKLHEIGKQRAAQKADAISLSSSSDEDDTPAFRIVSIGLQAAGGAKLNLRMVDV